MTLATPGVAFLISRLVVPALAMPGAITGPGATGARILSAHIRLAGEQDLASLELECLGSRSRITWSSQGVPVTRTAGLDVQRQRPYP